MFYFPFIVFTRRLLALYRLKALGEHLVKLKSAEVRELTCFGVIRYFVMSVGVEGVVCTRQHVKGNRHQLRQQDRTDFPVRGWRQLRRAAQETLTG